MVFSWCNLKLDYRRQIFIWSMENTDRYDLMFPAENDGIKCVWSSHLHCMHFWFDGTVPECCYSLIVFVAVKCQWNTYLNWAACITQAWPSLQEISLPYSTYVPCVCRYAYLIHLCQLRISEQHRNMRKHVQIPVCQRWGKVKWVPRHSIKTAPYAILEQIAVYSHTFWAFPWQSVTTACL